LEEVLLEMENPDIWSNPETAQALGKEKSTLAVKCWMRAVNSATCTLVEPVSPSEDWYCLMIACVSIDISVML
jgi:hypothetical protein